MQPPASAPSLSAIALMAVPLLASAADTTRTPPEAPVVTSSSHRPPPLAAVDPDPTLAHASARPPADAAASATVGPPAPIPDPARQGEYDQLVPKTVIQLQRFRATSEATVTRADGRQGTARLVDLQPYVGRAYLFELKWPGQALLSFHLESRRGLPLRLEDGDLVVEDPGGAVVRCDVVADGGQRLLAARGSNQAYTPLCDERVVLRGVVDGRKTSLEWTTDLLRDHVPGGDALTGLVRDTLFADSQIQRAELHQAAAPGQEASGGPAGAKVDPAAVGAEVVPPDLGIAVDGAAEDGGLVVGRWYPVTGQPGMFLSVMKPGLVDPTLAASLEGRISAPDLVEKDALVYSVAFDLSAFQLDFVLGTEHPRVEWSERAPDAVRARYPDLPGPDGFADAAPLARVGQVDPVDVPGLAAAFTGGFKRMHSAFKVGALSRANLGSHYGFVEDGVTYSKLQPGLATLVGWTDGTISLETWTDARDADVPWIRFARQNGVPLLEPSAADDGAVMPHPLVKEWAGGNWASSVDARLRSLRASASLVERDGTTYLVYSWFSAATPSGMALTLEAYGASYAMILDMNALEHTYLAVYDATGGAPVPHHLVTGMSVLDRKDKAGNVLPRFLAFPDNRDFFTVTRRK